MVGGGLVHGGVDGLALVLDVGDVAVVVVGGVGDGLEAAVGEVHLRGMEGNKGGGRILHQLVKIGVG